MALCLLSFKLYDSSDIKMSLYGFKDFLNSLELLYQRGLQLSTSLTLYIGRFYTIEKFGLVQGLNPVPNIPLLVKLT